MRLLLIILLFSFNAFAQVEGSSSDGVPFEPIVPHYTPKDGYLEEWIKQAYIQVKQSSAKLVRTARACARDNDVHSDLSNIREVVVNLYLANSNMHLGTTLEEDIGKEKDCCKNNGASGFLNCFYRSQSLINFLMLLDQEYKVYNGNDKGRVYKLNGLFNDVYNEGSESPMSLEQTNEILIYLKSMNEKKF